MAGPDKPSGPITALDATARAAERNRDPAAARCSFCGKGLAEAGRLLKGAEGAYICIACVISVNAELVRNASEP